MLLRIRWFILGAVTALATAVTMAVRTPFLRRRLSAPALREAGMRSAAGLLEAAATRVGTSSRR